MERINITPKTEKVLPITVKDVDYDVVIDTRDIALTTLVLGMADECEKLQQKIFSVKEAKNIEELRMVAQEALAKADEFYSETCKLIPDFAIYTAGQPIRDFRVWTQILFALSELINEGKAQKEVADELEEEATEEIGDNN